MCSVDSSRLTSEGKQGEVANNFLFDTHKREQIQRNECMYAIWNDFNYIVAKSVGVSGTSRSSSRSSSSSANLFSL